MGIHALPPTLVSLARATTVAGKAAEVAKPVAKVVPKVVRRMLALRRRPFILCPFILYILCTL